MNDCFLVFIKSFSLEQFSRVFTGIYQCLNLIHYALTVFRISYTKPFAGSIQNFYSCSSVVNQFIHHQRDKEFALQVLHVLRIAQESLEELFTVSKVVGSKPQKFILTGVVSGVAVHSPLSSMYFTSPSRR